MRDCRGRILWVLLACTKRDNEWRALSSLALQTIFSNQHCMISNRAIFGLFFRKVSVVLPIESMALRCSLQILRNRLDNSIRKKRYHAKIFRWQWMSNFCLVSNDCVMKVGVVCGQMLLLSWRWVFIVNEHERECRLDSRSSLTLSKLTQWYIKTGRLLSIWRSGSHSPRGSHENIILLVFWFTRPNFTRSLQVK